MRPLHCLLSALLLASAACTAHSQDAQDNHCPPISDGCGAIVIGPSVKPFLEEIENHLNGHEVQPTTTPLTDFTPDRRSVYVSGVLLADGQLLPNTDVNVIVDLGDGFSAYQPARTDVRGVWHAWFLAPAPILRVSADSAPFWVDADGTPEDESYAASAQGTASGGVGVL